MLCSSSPYIRPYTMAFSPHTGPLGGSARMAHPVPLYNQLLSCAVQRRWSFSLQNRQHKWGVSMGRFHINGPCLDVCNFKSPCADRHLVCCLDCPVGQLARSHPSPDRTRFLCVCALLEFVDFLPYCRSYEFAVCGRVRCSSPFHDYVAPSCSTKRQHHRLLQSRHRCVLGDL